MDSTTKKNQYSTLRLNLLINFSIYLLEKHALDFSRMFYHGSSFGSKFNKTLFPMFGFVLVQTKGCELGFGSQKLHLEPSILTLETRYPHNIGLNLSLA
jgi:hypothetical protein